MFSLADICTTCDCCCGLTFGSFVGANFRSFVGPIVFVSQQIKIVGVGDNYATFVATLKLYLQILALQTHRAKLREITGKT